MLNRSRERLIKKIKAKKKKIDKLKEDINKMGKLVLKNGKLCQEPTTPTTPTEVAQYPQSPVAPQTPQEPTPQHPHWEEVQQPVPPQPSQEPQMTPEKAAFIKYQEMLDEQQAQQAQAQAQAQAQTPMVEEAIPQQPQEPVVVTVVIHMDNGAEIPVQIPETQLEEFTTTLNSAMENKGVFRLGAEFLNTGKIIKYVIE